MVVLWPVMRGFGGVVAGDRKLWDNVDNPAG